MTLAPSGSSPSASTRSARDAPARGALRGEVLEVLGAGPAHASVGFGRRPGGGPRRAGGDAAGPPGVALLLQPVGRRSEEDRLAPEVLDTCPGAGELLAGDGDVSCQFGQPHFGVGGPGGGAE